MRQATPYLIRSRRCGINDIVPTISATQPSPGEAPSARRRAPTGPASRILHLVCPGTKLLDVAGPLQVFHDAKREDGSGAKAYRTLLLSRDGGEVPTDVGVALATTALSDLRVQPRDVILVPGGPGIFEAARDPVLTTWLARRAPSARIVASTCTGAFLLAASGLLDDKRAVTHWDDCADLQRRHPNVRVEEDPIFVCDGNVWTSAGVTAGIDLALAIVEHDLGRAQALDLARRLVVHSKRSGGQSQFSTRLRQQVAGGTGPFDALHDWVATHLEEDLRVERLASLAAMSPRTFHRTYTKTMGQTPARMVASMRIDAARRLLEETDEGIAAIALQCGFGTEDQLRRTFQRTLGLSPSAYRTSWSGQESAADD